MRERRANVHAEAHGRDLRCFDWVAPANADPHDVMLKAEAALGCKLHHRGDNEQHGYVNTRRLEDGSLHVCVVLYEDCADPKCEAGHGAVIHKRHPDPPAGKLAAMKKAVGEHHQHDITKDSVRKALGIDRPNPPVEAKAPQEHPPEAEDG